MVVLFLFGEYFVRILYYSGNVFLSNIVLIVGSRTDGIWTVILYFHWREAVHDKWYTTETWFLCIKIPIGSNIISRDVEWLQVDSDLKIECLFPA